MIRGADEQEVWSCDSNGTLRIWNAEVSEYDIMSFPQETEMNYQSIFNLRCYRLFKVSRK